METEAAQSANDSAHRAFTAPRATGRRLIKFDSAVDMDHAMALIGAATGTEPAAVRCGDVGLASTVEQAARNDSSVFIERFGIAAIGGRPADAAAAANALAAHDEVIDTRPEFWLFANESPPWQDSGTETWGLVAVGADQSGYDGAGIKIAVLDTGIDLQHPDFASRVIVHESFVAGETVDDIQGHGTHCAGTAAGRARAGGNVPRYGVAPAASLFVGKVLNNSGSGRELDIIAGIEWAIAQGCEVVSMSLGRPVSDTEPYDPIYEEVASRALDAGTLIIAAAGNESDRRYGYVAPVGSPANAPSVMAVAAIGADGGIASFSCGGTGVGQVDVAAPGVGIFSSVPRPRMYRQLMGTSMACPHVAGVAALWAQSDTTLRGRALWTAVVGSANGIGSLPTSDVGQGLVSTP